MNTASPVLAAITAFSSGSSGALQQVAGGDLQGRGDELGDGVGHVDDQGAPPEGRRGGGQAQHQPGHHLPPARLVVSQVLLDDEAEPHPAQDDHQGIPEVTAQTAVQAARTTSWS